MKSVGGTRRTPRGHALAGQSLRPAASQTLIVGRTLRSATLRKGNVAAGLGGKTAFRRPKKIKEDALVVFAAVDRSTSDAIPPTVLCRHIRSVSRRGGF